MDQTSPADETAKPAPRRKRAWLGPLLTFLVLLVAFVTNQKDALDTVNRIDDEAAAAVGSLSIVQFVNEFTDRFNACDYKYLVICEPKRTSVDTTYEPANTCFSFKCRLEHPERPYRLKPPTPSEYSSPNQLDIVLHAPDAIVYVLSQRFKQGVGPFFLMLTFVVINVMIIFFALGNGFPAFWASIALAPIATSALFWLMQQLLLAMTYAVGLFLQAFIIIAGIPLLLVWLRSAQEAHSLYVAGKDLIGKKQEEK